MTPSSPAPSSSSDSTVIALCVLTWVASYVLPIVTPPFSTFPNQWLAVLAWGLVLSGTSSAHFAPLKHPAAALAVAVGVALAGLAWHAGHPLAACVIGTAVGAYLFGLCNQDPKWTRALMISMVVAGLISSLLALQQIFAPELSGHFGLPPRGAATGRAVASLGQPNMLASLLLWALVALMGLLSSPSPLKTWSPWIAGLLGAGLALTGSRTGAVLLALGLVWAWRDRQLPPSSRRLPVFALSGALLGLGLNWLAAQHAQALFFASVRSQGHSDISSSRFAIWRDALDLVANHPWTGVGWGNFNFAWTLSEFPHRYASLTDNAHNLPLQLAVELGIPVAVAVVGILTWSLITATRHAWLPINGDHPMQHRAAWAMLVIIAIHSMLEYPLWYTYMLLPTAYLLGLCMNGPAPGTSATHSAPTSGATAQPVVKDMSKTVLQLVGALTVIGCLYAVFDFMQVRHIYAPSGSSRLESEQQRIEAGRASRLFGAYADYAAVVTAADPAAVFPAFSRPMHTLIDMHLLIAYARALETRGEHDKATFVAQRIREFDLPLAHEFFAPCATPGSPPTLPFQCAAKPSHLNLESFD